MSDDNVTKLIGTEELQSSSAPNLGESYDAPLVPPEFILTDLMLKGGSSVMYGDAGVGKSTALRILLLQAVRGADFAGRQFTKRCRVLFLALEQSRHSLVFRLRNMGMTREDAALIHVIGEDSSELERVRQEAFCTPGVGHMTILDWLTKRIREIRPDITLIDTVIDFMPLIRDANAYAEMYEKVLGPLRRMGRVNNTHIIGTHHENRSGSYMGSVAFKAAADNMLRLEGTDKDYRIISALRSNDGKVREGVELERMKVHCDGRFAPATRLDGRVAPHVEWERKIISCLEHQPHQTLDQIQEAIEWKGRGTEFHKLVSDMIDAGKIYRSPGGGRIPHKHCLPAQKTDLDQALDGLAQKDA